MAPPLSGRPFHCCLSRLCFVSAHFPPGPPDPLRAFTEVLDTYQSSCGLQDNSLPDLLSSLAEIPTPKVQPCYCSRLVTSSGSFLFWTIQRSAFSHSIVDSPIPCKLSYLTAVTKLMLVICPPFPPLLSIRESLKFCQHACFLDLASSDCLPS